jgi:ParB-like chromosome segregation protein Spo0J
VNWLDHTRAIFVNPREVDCEDATYYIPDFSDFNTLLKSIREIGIVNPPLLQKQKDGKLIPVLGRRRLMAARQAGLDRVEARMLPSEMPQTDGFRLAFWDNIPNRSLDPATLAVLVRRLLGLFPRQVVADEFIVIAGIHTNGPKLERLRKIGGLEPVLLEALAKGRIQEKTAATLTELAPEERLTLVDFTERLGMNANKKAEVISHLFDLSIFNSRPVLRFLEDERMVAIVENSDIPVPERAARVRNFIRSLKFPELARREEQFSGWLRSLPQSQRISVSPAPAFETCGCSIQISVDSPDQAERILARLKDAL